MRQPVHDKAVRFRANALLLAAANAKAKKSGMSLSEFLRHALREQVRLDV